MGVAAHSPPNYQAALASYSIPEGPVITYAGTPPGTTFVTALNGLDQAIYSYGGSNDVLRVYVRDAQANRLSERSDLRTSRYLHLLRHLGYGSLQFPRSVRVQPRYARLVAVQLANGCEYYVPIFWPDRRLSLQ
jgi:hypothetical protein